MIKNKKKKILLFISLTVLIQLLFVSVAFASQQTQSGSIAVSGTVNAPPPTNPPTIDQPGNNSQFNSNPVSIVGTCDTGLIVKIFRNDAFAGSGMCTNSGYSVAITLAVGSNTILARQYDSLDQASPDSNTITLTLTNPSNVSPSPVTPSTNVTSGSAAASVSNLLVMTDSSQHSALSGNTLTFPVIISGGVSPYAVSVSWDDGDELILARTTSDKFNVGHVYKKAGTYKVVIRVSDASGQQAYTEFIVTIGGANNPAHIKESIGHFVNLTWPLAGILVTGGAMFFIGAQAEEKLLRKRKIKHS